MICVDSTRDHISPTSHKTDDVARVAKRSMARSIGLSLAAFTGFALLLGAFAVPREFAILIQPQAVSIRHLVVNEPQQTLLAYCSCMSLNNEAPTYFQVSGQQLDQPTFDPQVITTLPMPARVCSVNGDLVAAEENGVLRRYTGTGETSDIIGRHRSGRVWKLACSLDQKILLAWDLSYTAWDLNSKQQLCEVPCEFRFAVLPQNATSLFCDSGPDFVERELLTGKELRVVASPGEVLNAALSPDGTRLATMGANRSIQVTDLKSGKLLWERNVGGPTSVSRLPIPFVAPIVVFSPNGNRLVCVHEIEKEKHWGLSVWHTHDGTLEQSFAAHSDRIRGVQFVGPQGLYTWADDCTLRKWELQTSDALLVSDWNTSNWRTRRD